MERRNDSAIWEGFEDVPQTWRDAIEESCRASGVPLKVEDAAVLARVARIITAS